MSETRIAPRTLEGWYVHHQLYRLLRPGLRRLEETIRGERVEEMAQLLSGWADLGEAGWTGSYRMVGGGVDVMLVHFRESLEELAEAKEIVEGLPLSDHLHLEMDYLSVVELGMYRVTAQVVGRLREEGVDPRSEEGREALDRALKEQADQGYVQRRLHPRQPDDMPYVCFYPMDKRRNSGQNWYRLPLEERNELMVEHGEIGRLYAGRISQVISGSTGLDDWEWAVTLFGTDPLDFKELVSEMRFDEVSARYAEFGPFFVGKRLQPEGWSELTA